MTPAFSGFPRRGDKIKKGYLTPTFSGAHKWAELRAFLGVPMKGDKIKSGCIGGKDKTVDMQPKRISPKQILAQMVCLH